jgi:hypothetical protein
MSILNNVVQQSKLIALALVVALLAAVSACQPPPPPPLDPIGQTLSDLSTTVQEIITNAGQTANGVLLTAGGAVQQDIDASASKYGDLFTKTINQVDAAAKANLDQLQTLTRQLSSQVQDTVRQTADQAAALLVQIGIGNNAPIVKSYGPHYTTAAAAANGLDLHLHGVFPRADQGGYAPTLEVNGIPQPSSSLTSNDLFDLTFHLPPQTFPDGVAGITPPNIEVDIPYAKGHIFKSIVPGVFHIQIATLPDSPVKSITLTTTTPGTTNFVPHPFQTQDVYLSSLDCKPHVDEPTLTPEHGWTFDPNSVKAVVGPGYPKGPSGTVDGPRVVTASPTSITMHASTSPACSWPFVEGGRTFYHYTYVELEPVVGAPVVNVQPLTLNWGDNLSADVPQNPGTWHLDVVLWNGVRLEGPPTVSNLWVTVRDLGNKVAYSAIDLSQVNLNDITPTS